MAEEFLLPDPGEGIHEADILEVHVTPGDEVKDGDPLFSVETDKAVVDIPASFDGQIEEIRVDVGDVVEVGSVLLTFIPLGEATTTGEAPPEEETSEEESEEPEAEPEMVSEPAIEDESDARDKAEDEEEPHPTPSEDERPKRPPVPASPATRSLAKRLGVELHEIEGSGPDGRIEPGDVKAVAGREEKPEPAVTEKAVPEERDEVLEWVDLRGVRRASARQMARAWREIPHVTHHDVADITELESLRRRHSAEIEEEGGRLSVTAFLVKAAAVALTEHRRFNASIDMDNERVAIKRHINIGVAVDTDDGLVVPVISDADQKSISEVAGELPELAKRMRNGDRSLEDFEGGTFTITNPGGIGGTSFEPIINHPEVAILGAARARETPAFSDNGEDVVARLHLPLVLGFDHRVNDGADAARFMNTIKGLLEDPAKLLLRA